MSYLTAVAAIISAFLCGWALVIAMNPRKWRIWWMSFLRIVDIGSTREQRRSQEHQLMIVAYIGFSIFLAASGFCGYLAWDQWQSSREPRSEADQERERAMHVIEKMKEKKNFRKLN